MLTILGTIPDESFPLTKGPLFLKGSELLIEKRRVSLNRGTPALAGAALKAAEAIGLQDIEGIFVGDIGRGQGSRKLYDFLTRKLPGFVSDTLMFHYLQPDVDWHNKILFAIENMAVKPKLIADAGFMYAAKMSGQAKAYDLFTPDVGELAFLADETAPHPFYTRGFILHENNRITDLIKRAYKHENAASHLMVKGKIDHITRNGEILFTIEKPSTEAMEAIGGTGDTLVGIICALITWGMNIPDACRVASLANRLAGLYARPTPATQIISLIQWIPKALTQSLTDLAII